MAEPNVKDLEDINLALTRARKRVKDLQASKKQREAQIYNYMKHNGLENYHGFKLSKLEPKPKAERKKKKEKENAAIDLFRAIGVNDPGALYERFLETQTAKIEDK